MTKIAEARLLRHLKETALANQGGLCRYCFAPLHPLTATAEHRKPRARGGLTTPRNIAASCPECNAAKGSMKEGDFVFLLVVGGRASTYVLLARFRRRMWVAAHRANTNILAAAGLPYRNGDTRWLTKRDTSR